MAASVASGHRRQASGENEAMGADRRRSPSPVYCDVPDDVLVALRGTVAHLPELVEQQAWTGRRWRVRQGTVAHVFCVDGPEGPTVGVQFRAPAPEFGVLVRQGHPFFRAGWGSDVLSMVLDEATDWTEVRELLTESYCLMAPKKLVALLDRPEG